MGKKKNKKKVVDVKKTPETDKAKSKVPVSPEVAVIDKKITDLQKKYREAMKVKNEQINKLKAVDEEITKMVGAFNTLQELRVELAGSAKKPEDEPKADAGKDETKETDVKEEEKIEPVDDTSEKEPEAEDGTAEGQPEEEPKEE